MLLKIVYLSLVVLHTAQAVPRDKRTFNPFIIGGQDAPVGKYKWQLSLQVDGGHSCGATLIDKRWAFTAAHCITAAMNTNPGVATVIAGVTKLDAATIASEGQTIAVAAIYKKDPNGKDVALLKLAADADLSKPNIAVIKIADRCEIFDNKMCMISGWGVTNAAAGGTPTDLQEASMNVLTLADCGAIYGRTMQIYEVCITKPNTITSACFGDSGGPMACNRADGSWVLLGSTAYGNQNCVNTPPNVYMRVPFFRDWIRATTGLTL